MTALFPAHHVLVVSNSAGSYGDDVDWIEADAVERAFTSTSPVHVLRHRHKKPSRRCASEIWDYFDKVKQWRHGQTERPRLVFVGDRIMTDILLANEMGAYSILTTRLWKRNDVLFLRYIESAFLATVRAWLWLKTQEWRRMAGQSYAMMRTVGRGFVGIWSLLVRRQRTQSLQAKDENADDVLRVGHGAVHPRAVTKKIHNHSTLHRQQ